MKQLALALVAVGLICLAAGQASAAGALSHPMAAHVAAQYGIQHSGLPTQVKLYHQASFHHERHHMHLGHHGQCWHHRRHYGHPPVIVRPYAVYPRPYYPYYYPRPYYYARPGITYRGQGFSIGIGF